LQRRPLRCGAFRHFSPSKIVGLQQFGELLVSVATRIVKDDPELSTDTFVIPEIRDRSMVKRCRKKRLSSWEFRIFTNVRAICYASHCGVANVRFWWKADTPTIAFCFPKPATEWREQPSRRSITRAAEAMKLWPVNKTGVLAYPTG
jgi:hypothetical protein